MVAATFSVPIAQSTERECPKLQVAGESPAGDTISRGCGSTAEYGRAKAETTVRLRPPAPFFRGCSSSAERSFDMREAKRAALFVPTISEGIAQPARADASHASGRRRKPSCPHHFCPCGVVHPTCLPLKQEITGAKPVRDANSVRSAFWPSNLVLHRCNVPAE